MCKSKVKIVYDVDNVLNNLMDYICEAYNIDIKKIRRYDISENIELTYSEKNKIFRAFNDKDIFLNLKYDESIGEILNCNNADNNIEVHIHSLSMNHEIESVKYSKIIELLKNIDESNIVFEVGSKKSVMHDVDVLVEDCIENCVKANVKKFCILLDKTYNQADEYGICEKDYNIIRVRALCEGIEVIRNKLSI